MAQLGVPFELAIVASEIGSYKPALGHWHAFERETGRLPDVHVAAQPLPRRRAVRTSSGCRRSGSTDSARTPGPEPTRDCRI